MAGQRKIGRMAEIERELQELPKGKVFQKTIKGKQQPYLQWSEHGKAMTKYVKMKEREEVFRQLEYRDQLEKELEELKKEPEMSNSRREYYKETYARFAFSEEKKVLYLNIYYAPLYARGWMYPLIDTENGLILGEPDLEWLS